MAVRQLNRLSAREVASAKDGWHADGGGLYLRVSDAGTRRRWVFRFTLNRRSTEIGLGSSVKGAVTLAEARAERAKLADKVKTGLNPLAERRRVQSVEASRKTFAEAAEAFIRREASGWSDSHVRLFKRSYRPTSRPSR